MDPYITILRCKMLLTCEKYSKLGLLLYSDLFPRRIFLTENRENNWRKTLEEDLGDDDDLSFLGRGWKIRYVHHGNGILAERLRSYVTRWIRYCEFSSSKLLRWEL